MARPLFEQYKDALRRGHVAMLGGELDAALDAYREAAALVPDRALPYAGIGGVLQRLGRSRDAVAAYDRALALAPDDLEAASSRAAALASAEAGAEPGAGAPGPAELVAEPAAGPVAPIVAEPIASDDPVATAWPAIDLPSPPIPRLEGPPPDPIALQAEAEALLDAGDEAAARDRLITAALVYREAGRLDAAIDACLQLLALAPGDPRVHLAIANLQLDLGWRDVATEKIELLLRLTSLSGDARAEADVHLLAADRLRDESPARLDARRRGLPTS